MDRFRSQGTLRPARAKCARYGKHNCRKKLGKRERFREERFSEAIISCDILGMYPIHDVTQWTAERPEALGSKEKFWVTSPEGFSAPNKPHLFKVGRVNTGENWAEKVSCEISKVLKIPCAEYNFAVHAGRQGVISESIFPPKASFLPGNMLFSTVDPEYEGTLRFKQVRYKLHTAIEILRRAQQLKPPLGFSADNPEISVHDLFIGYLILDALIGNTDRHHENWGVIVDEVDGATTYRLGPTFDHASSLGRDLTAETCRQRLNTKDARFSAAAYAERAKSAFYGPGRAGKPLSRREVVKTLVESFPGATKLWAARVSGLERVTFEEILGKVPESLISAPSAEFALSLLAYNQQMIREVALGR